MAIETRSLLHDLHLASPPSGPRNTDVRVVPPSEIHRQHGEPIALPSPLFAYDLPWYLMAQEQAAQLASELTKRMVVTSVLNLDVAGERPEDLVMCPYRPERYGVTRQDLHEASFVDLRLTTEVGDGSIYTKEQIGRWDARADSLPDETIITGSRWPADVADTSKLGGKVSQLRELAPKAAIFETISPFHLQSDLPHVIDSAPDGVILRFDVDPTSPSAVGDRDSNGNLP